MEEGFDFDWSAFYGAEVSVGEGVEFAVYVCSCFAVAFLVWGDCACSFA